MRELLTDQARQVCMRAQEESRALGHGYVGTEHLLLGLLYTDAGLATEVLASFGLSAAGIRHDVETMVTRGNETAPGDRPLTPRAAHALECAEEEARILQQREVGPEHLLLGLLREPEGVAGLALRKRGLNLERLRLDTARIRLLQMAAVERIVRPMRATADRKRKIREELLAHVEAGFEQDLPAATDSLAAVRAAAARLGDPAEVCRQIQASLPAYERVFYWMERSFSRRGVESYGRWFVRGMIHSSLLVVPLFGIALAVNAWRIGWNASLWPGARFMLMLFLKMPALLFVVGVLHFKLRDAYWGAFGMRRSRARVLAYGALLFGVLAVSLFTFVTVSGLDPFNPADRLTYVAVVLVTVLGPVLSFATARQVGAQEISDSHWASLNLAELEPLLAK